MYEFSHLCSTKIILDIWTWIVSFLPLVAKTYVIWDWEKIESSVTDDHAFQRSDRGKSKGTVAPLKPMKVTLFTTILYNSKNSIRDIRPFCRPLLCHSSVVK